MIDYEGDPTLFPASIPLLSLADATPPTASEINVPIEGLIDRTANLDARLTRVDRRTAWMPTRNFRLHAVAGAGAGSRPFYNRAVRAWVMPGVEIIKLSIDGGNAWYAAPSTPSLATHTTRGGAADPSGNMVITTTGRNIFQLNAGAWTWSMVDAWGSAPGVGLDSRVVYDRVNGRWIWFATALASLNPKLKWSTTRTAWTDASTPPAGDWDQDHVSPCLACNGTTGRTVAMVQQTNKVVVATSDDGGVTWTARTSLPSPTFSSTDYHASLVCNEATGEWLFAQGETTGTPTSTVYRSTNGGETWTLVATLTASCLASVALLGDGILVGMSVRADGQHDVVGSDDGGVTWRYAGFIPRSSSDVGGVHVGDGAICVPVTGEVYLSLRQGTPDLGVLT